MQADSADPPALPLPPGAILLNDALQLAMREYHAGRLPEAAAVAEAILQARPDHAGMLHLLGVLRFQMGDTAAALAMLDRTVTQYPDFADAHGNLGTVLQMSGRIDEAIIHFRRAIALQPDSASVHYNLGNALSGAGRFAEAVAPYLKALELDPHSPTILCNLGNALLRQCRYEEAITCYRRAIVIRPDHGEGHNNLGHALKEMGRISEAIEAFTRAIQVKGDIPDAFSNLGSALKDQARHREAKAAFERALALDPAMVSAHSNLVFLRNYLPEETERTLLDAHRAWDDRHGRPLLPAAPRFTNTADPERRLRIGYVSPDFRTHSVSYFFEPLLLNHDRAQVEVFCYAEVAVSGPVTERLRAGADHWRFTVGLDDAVLADRIRADGIDILVDLAGHTGHNRLPVFARKPAPVQVTWLGYPNITGLSAIDYRITDAIADPATPDREEEKPSSSEALIRLPDGFLCYRAAPGAPAVSPAPLARNGHATFGSFNNLAKLTADTIDAWARLLTRVPGARLFLKSKQLADPGTSRLFLDRFAARGIGADRIDLASWTPSPLAHLELYSRVDIALDTFPYNGTTTTCEALWMGVPVVTLRGDRHAARVGASLLTRVGLSDLIAPSVDAYLDTAAALAGDPARLIALRAALRDGMAGSPLCDGPGFAARMETAYRTMWRRWCAAG